MNVKAFFVDALGTALELELGTPDDVLRHVTPEILAQHLPRPLWARLLTACLGAPRVDARLVVETIGVHNLCEHVPANIIWACIADIGDRAIGVVALRPPSGPSATPIPAPRSMTPPTGVPTRPTPPQPLMSPPPEAVAPAAPAPRAPVAAPGRPIPTPVNPNQPLSDLIDELEADAPPIASGSAPRTRPPVQSRFRPNQTNIGQRTTAATVRRPQVAAPAARPLARRGATEPSEVEADTEIGKEGWSKDTAVAVDDSQLVDWSPNDTADNNDKR